MQADELRLLRREPGQRLLQREPVLRRKAGRRGQAFVQRLGLAPGFGRAQAVDGAAARQQGQPAFQRAFAGVYEDAVLVQWLRNFYRRFFAQQFKRSCLPDGPKVGTVTLSPRGDWRMPSDACAALWLAQVEELEQAL